MKRPLLFLAALAIGACGSRTGLLSVVEGAPDASAPDVVDAGPPDVGADVVADAPVDVAPDAPPTPCTTDAECDDRIGCTVDRCDLATGTCAHRPDNALCPPGFACRPPCEAASFAETFDFLYGVDLPGGAVASIGSTRAELDDIALDPHGLLYAVGPADGIYIVDAMTGAASVFAYSPTGVTLNALDFAPDGTLYGAGGDTVYTLDTMSGRANVVARYPAPYTSSGDLAIIGNQLLATVTVHESGNDWLLSVDLTTFDTTVIGRTDSPKIYGLAAYGKLLFGFTYGGDVLQIDPKTARSTVLAKTGHGFYGASAR